MGIEVSLRDRSEALEVILHGVADDALLSELGGAVRAVVGPERTTVLNLDGLTLVNPEALRALVEALVGDDQAKGSRVCLVCKRLTARGLLRRWKVTPDLAIYATLDSALAEAGRLRSGYGEGRTDDAAMAEAQ